MLLLSKLKATPLSRACNDGLGECLIIEDEWDPYVRRMLASGYGDKSKIRNKPVITCGKTSDPYRNCIHTDCIKCSPYSAARNLESFKCVSFGLSTCSIVSNLIYYKYYPITTPSLL